MANSIQRHFGQLPDPRRGQGRRHALADMIVIAVTAVICAADSWADVAEFGRAKHKWFKTFLELPHDIPSQDTFERVIARLNPEAFEHRGWSRKRAPQRFDAKRKGEAPAEPWLARSFALPCWSHDLQIAASFDDVVSTRRTPAARSTPARLSNGDRPADRRAGRRLPPVRQG